MFSVDIKINGVLIAHLYGQNRGYADYLRSEDSSYKYEYHVINKRGTPVVYGNLTHNRADGIEILVHKILEKIINE